VLTVQSSALNDLHEHLQRIGCKHSYVPYKPHATLIYNVPIDLTEQVKKDIEAEIAKGQIFLTLTKFNNDRVNEDWVKQLNS